MKVSELKPGDLIRAGGQNYQWRVTTNPRKWDIVPDSGVVSRQHSSALSALDTIPETWTVTRAKDVEPKTASTSSWTASNTLDKLFDKLNDLADAHLSASEYRTELKKAVKKYGPKPETVMVELPYSTVKWHARHGETTLGAACAEALDKL